MSKKKRSYWGKTKSGIVYSATLNGTPDSDQIKAIQKCVEFAYKNCRKNNKPPTTMNSLNQDTLKLIEEEHLNWWNRLDETDKKILTKKYGWDSRQFDVINNGNILHIYTSERLREIPSTPLTGTDNYEVEAEKYIVELIKKEAILKGMDKPYIIPVEQLRKSQEFQEQIKALAGFARKMTPSINKKSAEIGWERGWKDRHLSTMPMNDFEYNNLKNNFLSSLPETDKMGELIKQIESVIIMWKDPSNEMDGLHTLETLLSKAKEIKSK